MDVPASTAKRDPATIVLPEKLVQVQAYLRWERNGKQSYSQEQEKVWLMVRHDLPDKDTVKAHNSCTRQNPCASVAKNEKNT